ncbi:hypothetical protein ABDK56_06380 [Sphingomonas sp. ASV193]|uniref:hypothetical protein n=1 Tax=Sphingomonas sp. ASV193 TaxID=3144405 RepID=UPI0032E8AD6E
MSVHTPGIIERAFQLAQDSTTVDQIRGQLRREGYSSVDAHLMGRKIRGDLVRIMRLAVAASVPV